MKTLIPKILMSVLSLLMLSSCGDNTPSTETSGTNSQNQSVKGTATILYPTWTEGVAMTHLAKVVLEDKGFAIKIMLVEPGPLYASLAKGDADLYLDAWLPNTHKDYWARFGDQLEIIGTVFDDASSGLVVPSYIADINSIEELNDHAKRFNGRIYGDGAGAGLHHLTLQAIDEYGLKFEQLGSSESAMIAALKRAVANQEPVIITGWKPHYMWRDYDLKLLKDPKDIFKTDQITILSRKGFTTDQPEIAHFFENFKFNADQLHELIEYIGEDDRNPNVGARKFYEKHQAMIDSWLAQEG